jgi:hypothetical protein
MKIKFREYEKVQGERKDGSIWTAYKIHGSVLMSDNQRKAGDLWKSTNIFDNENTKGVLAKLFALESGDKVDVKHAKTNTGWAITDIVPTTDEEEKPSYPKRKSGGTQSQGRSASGTSDAMSKAEWAAKNETDRIRIAKSVALKAAIAGVKIGTKPEAIVELAQAFMPFLTDDKLPLSVNTLDDGTDPLDPPA